MVLCKERILGFMEEEEIATNNNKKELIREFKSAMECILDYLDGKVFDTSHVKVLMLKGAFDWNKIYSMIKRERRRLHDGLPIYAHRTNILRQIHCHQVMVLTTGSGGKSTRLLVQFLADSGVAGDKSIVCTQPRKLSAMSFAANRVDNQKVIYMTDHCLLEHYMNDNNFSWASCIIVNQAHETSLNTDLLLALMKQLLNRRSDLRLIIMSAAADSQELSEYFFGCPVLGTTTPADTTHLPEIHKVGLRIALLRILALGIHTIDFIHAPCNESIETAIKHLVQLGAIVLENDAHKLTRDGWILAKLGIEPRFGKMALKCFENGLGREGLVLAAVMANSGCIFYKGGKSDRFKLQFCHPGGDLFTMLSVYRKWECTSHDNRSQWCRDNSINPKSMRRCQEAVQEMETCLQHELNVIIPACWCWNPMVNTEYDQTLKDAILSVLADNIAMYSGNDNLGYEVASTGAHVQLHPSCSLLLFSKRPSWVVFAMGGPYLVCVTCVDFDSLHALSPAPFDISQMEGRKLQLNVFTGFGRTLLKRFLGESGSCLKALVSCMRDRVNDDRIQLEVSVYHNKVTLFAPSEHMTRASKTVRCVLEREISWIQNECFEKCLFPGGHPVALLGLGAEIKHLELEKRYLTVDVSVDRPRDVIEKQLLSYLENHTDGDICAVHKFNKKEKWGRVTFLTPEVAEKATKLDVDEPKVTPSRRSMFGGEDLYVKTNVVWPCRRTLGVAIDKCYPNGDAVENPSLAVLEEALLREVRSLMPAGAENECVRVHIFPCKPKDSFMKADIMFYGSLHLEAAKALEQIDGKAFPGCQTWQKIIWQQHFTSIVSCPAPVYIVIKDQLHSLLKTLELRKEAEFVFERNENGTPCVKISAKDTKLMLESRRPLELLMNGRTIIDHRLSPPVMQLIFSREGRALNKSIQRETGTYFLFDKRRHSYRVFGPLNKLDLAQDKLVQSLVALHADRRQLDIHLRGSTFPPDFMKKVVEKFGPGLDGIKEIFPGSDFTLNTRHQIISIRGTKEWTLIHEILGIPTPSTPRCSICLCDMEDGYCLETCNHEFCRSCLVQQCESAIKNPGNSFPIRCARKGCKALMVAADLKSLLLMDKLDELFRASLGSFVASSRGKYRFCPSPDCSSVYQVTEDGRPFACGACFVETCTRCHLEYHPLLSCETYKESKRDPDLSLKEWIQGKQEVRQCPVCMCTIEKIDGCNHVKCRCGIHICWVCRQ